MIEETMLPAAFRALEPFAERWCLSDPNARYERRLASSMPELQAFYEAVVARSTEIMAHLRERDPKEMDEPSRNLLWMMCSLSTVSFAVDVFKQPEVPDTCGATMPWTTTAQP